MTEVQKQKERIENSLEKAVDDIHKTHLRKIQAELHRCALKCCENTTYSMDQTNRCVAQCSVRLEESQSYVRTELQNFQTRLHRCVLQCNDAVQDGIPANPTEKEIAKFSREFEACAKVCVDKHIGLLPNFVMKMKEVLAKGNMQAQDEQTFNS